MNNAQQEPKEEDNPASPDVTEVPQPDVLPPDEVDLPPTSSGPYQSGEMERPRAEDPEEEGDEEVLRPYEDIDGVASDG